MSGHLEARTASGRVYLDHFPETGGPLQRIWLERFPFRLGRDPSADLVISSARVSKSHAVLTRSSEDVIISDLGSTNGTFVNGKRIEVARVLLDGDIIHLAQKEFRFGLNTSPESSSALTFDTESAFFSFPRSLIQDTRSLRELIQQQQVFAFFQPIVSLLDQQVIGYEALGRGGHEQLPSSPGPLFALAGQCELSVPLSRAFRRAALLEAEPLPPPRLLFLNVHVDELRVEHLLESLQELVAIRGDWQVIVEVHADFVGDLATIRRLRHQLRTLEIRLAYDDFGVSQTRLTALAQVPPDFVKLDLSMVQGLPHSRPMRELVRALARVCVDQGTRLIAEGVETEAEAAISHELGCELGQGYWYAHPQSAANLARWAVAERVALDQKGV